MVFFFFFFNTFGSRILTNEVIDLDYRKQTEPCLFFRPGQVFTLRIGSEFFLKHKETVDHSNLPLEPIHILQERAEAVYLAKRKTRLNQIYQLPLSYLSSYCEEDRYRRGYVRCLSCDDSLQKKGETFMTKDEWVTFHFRVEHWNFYLKICRAAKVHPDGPFSSESWITLDDVASDDPILTDDEIMSVINVSTQEGSRIGAPGPILIRRFVVVQEGPESSLCLGIHT